MHLKKKNAEVFAVEIKYIHVQYTNVSFPVWAYRIRISNKFIQGLDIQMEQISRNILAYIKTILLLTNFAKAYWLMGNSVVAHRMYTTCRLETRRK